MKYILSNAQILKQSRLVDSDILVDHGNIVSISGQLRRCPILFPLIAVVV